MAFAIVETYRKADYLHQADRFSQFSDHRNLRYIFDPTSVGSPVSKYGADKLHRWTLLLMVFNYGINDISRDSNVGRDCENGVCDLAGVQVFFIAQYNVFGQP